MARQLPNRPDPTVEQTDEPSVLYLDDDGTERVVSALSSETGLAVFRLLNRTPMTASEVADELGVTVQNAGYHLENLTAANLIEVIDTCYSEKGREMDIYAVTTDPKVLVLATDSDRSHLRSALGQLAGAVGITGVIVATWQYLAGTAEGLLEV